MFVSIIVPSYNHAPYLQERIESILNQSFKNFEVIILDDKSPDDSYRILEKYKDHPKVSHCIINEQNSGSTFFQWNKGLELAKGELIWIAESDDVADSEFLATLVPQFVKNPQLVLAYSQSYRMNAIGEITGSWKDQTDIFDSEKFSQDFLMNGLQYSSKFLCHKNTIPNASAVLFKKQTYFQVDKANPALKYIGDWEIWTKIVFQGDIFFSATHLNYFRYHTNSVIAQVKSNLDKRQIEVEKQLELFRKNIISILKNIQDNPAALNITNIYTKKLNANYKKIIKKSYQEKNENQAKYYINEFKKNAKPYTLLRFYIKWIFYKFFYR